MGFRDKVRITVRVQSRLALAFFPAKSSPALGRKHYYSPTWGSDISCAKAAGYTIARDLRNPCVQEGVSSASERECLRENMPPDETLVLCTPRSATRGQEP